MPIARFVRRRGLRGVFFLKKNRLAQIFFHVLKRPCTPRSCGAKTGAAMLRAEPGVLACRSILGLTRIVRRIGSFILCKRHAVAKNAYEQGISCQAGLIEGACGGGRGGARKALSNPSRGLFRQALEAFDARVSNACARPLNGCCGLRARLI
jgi:hypothetical protein